MDAFTLRVRGHRLQQEVVDVRAGNKKDPCLHRRGLLLPLENLVILLGS